MTGFYQVLHPYNTREYMSICSSGMKGIGEGYDRFVAIVSKRTWI